MLVDEFVVNYFTWYQIGLISAVTLICCHNHQQWFFYFKGLLPPLDSIKNLDLSPLQTHFGSSTSWSSQVFHISCWRTFCLEHSFSAMLISSCSHSLHYLNTLSDRDKVCLFLYSIRIYIDEKKRIYCKSLSHIIISPSFCWSLS